MTKGHRVVIPTSMVVLLFDITLQAEMLRRGVGFWLPLLTMGCVAVAFAYAFLTWRRDHR